jgi:rhodanese-related sulfurtransferase
MKSVTIRAAWGLSASMLCLSLLGGCMGPRKVSDRDIEVVDLNRVLELIENQRRSPEDRELLLIDSRSRSSFESGHIPGARHLPLQEIDPELGRDPEIESYDDIVVYADNPGSPTSKAVAKRLMRLRYDDVRLFAGGLEAWLDAGLPVEDAAGGG